jgi:ferritin
MKSVIINESISPADPTIIKTPNTLKKEVYNILNSRIGDEYAAHYFYRSAANWCHNMSYKKAAAFFDSEAQIELEHALKLQKYLTDWDMLPVIPQAPTAHKFNNLAEIVVGSYDMEYALFQTYSENSKIIFGIDIPTFDFLQFFRNEQTAAVAEFADLLNALQLINPENNFELLYFENQYFG